jgi:hypothetical protein
MQTVAREDCIHCANRNRVALLTSWPLLGCQQQIIWSRMASKGIAKRLGVNDSGPLV